MSRISVTYRVRSDAAAIDSRAKDIAVEQSVETPLAAISDERVLRDIVGEVQGVRELQDGLFEVRIGVALETTGFEAGQLLNMLVGNVSLQEDVTLYDAEIPGALAVAFGGPNFGIAGLRAKCGAVGRALTCTALKPQGLSVKDLAALAERLAEGGVDYIKDDHGLADQATSLYADRVCACAAAIRRTGSRTVYAPNISGSLDDAVAQIAVALDEGIQAVMVAPMLFGVANFNRLARRFPNLAFFAHPSLAGVSRIAPPLLMGKLFRLFGADVTIYPNYGGRFSYMPETCRAIAQAARAPWAGLKPCLPAPAGGMTLGRVSEILDFYGPDTMLLIGGSLLSEKHRLTEATAEFVARVAGTSPGKAETGLPQPFA